MRKNISFLFMFFLFFGGFLFPSSSQESESFYSVEQATEKLPPRPPHPRRNMYFNGRKMPHSEENLSVIGIKIDEEGENLSISVFFNFPLDTNSILERNIFVNDRSLPPFTEFLFNRNRKMMRFPVKKDFIQGNEEFSLKIIGARSFDGRKMPTFESEKIKPGDFLKIPIEQQFVNH